MLELQVERPDFAAAIRALAIQASDKAAMVLESAGIDTIAFLRSLTEEMRPPVRSGQGERQAHPGHWADVTGQLVNSYAWAVASDISSRDVVLILSNGAEYAAALEKRDGYYVLKDVAEPGGPLEQAIRRAVAVIAPEWRVVSG